MVVRADARCRRAHVAARSASGGSGDRRPLRSYGGSFREARRRQASGLGLRDSESNASRARCSCFAAQDDSGREEINGEETLGPRGVQADPRPSRPLLSRYEQLRTHLRAARQQGREDNKVETETPWDVGVLVQVITLWLIGFVLVGGVCIPIITHWFGFHEQARLGLPPEHWKQALFTVTVDVVEMCVGLGVLRACIGRYSPLKRGFFPLRMKGKWPIAVLLGCCLFPFVQYVANVSEGVQLSSSPVFALSLFEWLPREILKLSPVELVSQSVYVFWTTCMSPIWEEILFRGFLIPSFARYLPSTVSIVLSAMIFALLHFSLNRVAPLTVLGILLGVVFTRTNNLFAPVVLHSLWNVFAFISAFSAPA